MNSMGTNCRKETRKMFSQKNSMNVMNVIRLMLRYQDYVDICDPSMGKRTYRTSVPSTPGLGVTFALSLNMEDTQDTTDESANVAPAPRAPFDITRHEPANASTLDEGHIGNPALSATVLGEEELTFHILEAGTERRGRKLVSSDGYSYCVKISGKHERLEIMIKVIVRPDFRECVVEIDDLLLLYRQMSNHGDQCCQNQSMLHVTL